MLVKPFPTVAILFLAGILFCSCTRDPADELAKAKSLADKNDFAGAILILKSALQESPNNGNMRFLLGHLYNQTFNPKSAEKELKLARDNGVVDGGRVSVELARALRGEGKFEELLKQVKPDAAYELPQLASVYALRGRAQHALRLDEDSRESFKKASSIEPANLDVGLLDAQIKAGAGNSEGALKTIDEMLKKRPDFYDGWSYKSEILRHLGRDDAALASYSEVLKINPRDFRALLSRPTFFIRKRKLEDAQKDIDLFLRTYPGHPFGLVQRGLLQLAKEDYKDALESARLALKVAPKFAAANAVAGAANFGLKEYASAESYLSSSITQNPNNDLTRRVFAVTLLRTGQANRTLEVIEPLVGADGKNSNDFIVAGDAYLQLGEVSQAQAAFARAAELDPKNPSAKISRGLTQIGTDEELLGLEQIEDGVMLDRKPSQADEMLILALLRRNEVERAAATLTRLEKRTPNNTILGNLQGVVLMAQGKREDAVKVFAQVLARDPSFSPAAVNLARINLLENKPEAAIQQYQTLLAANPNNVDVMLAIAEIEGALGKRAEETAILERAVAAAPKSLLPRARLMSAYSSAGNKGRALSTADAALTANPDNPQMILLAAQTQFSSGNQNRAIDTMKNLIRLSPKVGNGYRLLAEFQAAAGQTAQAEQTLRKIIDIDPNYPPAKITLVSLLLAQKKYTEASEYATTIQKTQINSPLGFVLQGEILEAQKKYTEAAGLYTAALQRQDVGEIAVKLFQAEAAGGDLTGARLRLVTWADAHPADPVARSKIGDLTLAKGDYSGAVKHYEQAVKLPNIPLEVRNKLAWAYYKINDSRALATAQAVVKDAPNYALAVDTLGWIMTEKGNAKSGLPYLRRAQALSPGNLDIGYHVAVALERTDKRDEARAVLTRLLENTSENQQFESKAEAIKFLASLK